MSAKLKLYFQILFIKGNVTLAKFVGDEVVAAKAWIATTDHFDGTVDGELDGGGSYLGVKAKFQLKVVDDAG
jgi:hypothetical protein